VGYCGPLPLGRVREGLEGFHLDRLGSLPSSSKERVAILSESFSYSVYYFSLGEISVIIKKCGIIAALPM